MKLAFLMNALDSRGLGMATYHNAHLNEARLGNESLVFYNSRNPFNHPGTVQRYAKRFPLFDYANLEQANLTLRCVKADACYVPKSGEIDEPAHAITCCPQLNHAVFGGVAHGHRFAWVSEWLSSHRGKGEPYVPAVVLPPPNLDNLRAQLGISPDAVVFGRHGGWDSFNIKFVQATVTAYARAHSGVYFVFLSTEPFCSEPNVRFLPTTDSWPYIYQFINTCDAMIHARDRGETFGVACAQFNAARKLVITYGNSPELAHLDILGEQVRVYTDPSSLVSQLDRFCAERTPAVDVCSERFSPEAVIQKFQAVFLT